MLNFEVLKTDPADGAYLGSFARRGTLTLNHGVVQTPIFMPVGTYGTVKGVMPRSLEEMGAQIILGNTFHLWMRPGLDVMKSFGGLHDFERWTKPILTDDAGAVPYSSLSTTTINLVISSVSTPSSQDINPNGGTQITITGSGFPVDEDSLPSDFSLSFPNHSVECTLQSVTST